MSANNKRARKLNAARDMKGRKGPASTTPKHGKKKAWHQIGSKRIMKTGADGEIISFTVGTKN